MLYELILVVTLGILSTLYLTFDIWKEKSSFIDKAAKCWKEKKNIIIYSFVSIVCGLSICICLNYIYEDNLVMTNIKLLTLLMLLFPIAWIDYKCKIIPNKLILSGVVVRIIYILYEMLVYSNTFSFVIKDILYAIAIVLIFFLLGVLVMKSGVGMGDIKLLFVIALYQGIRGMFSSLFFSLLIAFLVSIFLLVSHKKTKKDTMPFAPSILLGTMISIAVTGM